MAGGVPMARIDFFDLSVRYAVILAKSFWIEPICKVDPNSEDTQGSRVGHRVQTQKAMSPDAADRYSASKSEAQGPYGLGLSRPVCNSCLSGSRLSAFLRSFIFVTHGEPGDEENGGAQKKRAGALFLLSVAYRAMFLISSVAAEARSPSGPAISLVAEE